MRDLYQCRAQVCRAKFVSITKPGFPDSPEGKHMHAPTIKDSRITRLGRHEDIFAKSVEDRNVRAYTRAEIGRAHV